jgi:hypothetical protein
VQSHTTRSEALSVRWRGFLPFGGGVSARLEDVALYVAQATSDAEVAVDVEHDRFEWVSLEVAVRRCLPSVVAEGIRIAARAASRR